MTFSLQKHTDYFFTRKTSLVFCKAITQIASGVIMADAGQWMRLQGHRPRHPSVQKPVKWHGSLSTPNILCMHFTGNEVQPLEWQYGNSHDSSDNSQKGASGVGNRTLLAAVHQITQPQAKYTLQGVHGQRHMLKIHKERLFFIESLLCIM